MTKVLKIRQTANVKRETIQLCVNYIPFAVCRFTFHGFFHSAWNFACFALPLQPIKMTGNGYGCN